MKAEFRCKKKKNTPDKKHKFSETISKDQTALVSLLSHEIPLTLWRDFL